MIVANAFLFPLVRPIAIIVNPFLQSTVCRLSQSQPYPLLQISFSECFSYDNKGFP